MAMPGAFKGAGIPHIGVCTDRRRWIGLWNWSEKTGMY